jgi:hypothetical protein
MSKLANLCSFMMFFLFRSSHSELWSWDWDKSLWILFRLWNHNMFLAIKLGKTATYCNWGGAALHHDCL